MIAAESAGAFEVYQEGMLPKEKTDAEGNVWYLAFGSNMNPLSFIKRRGINPLKSLPGKVRDW